MNEIGQKEERWNIGIYIKASLRQQKKKTKGILQKILIQEKYRNFSDHAVAVLETKIAILILIQ